MSNNAATLLTALKAGNVVNYGGILANTKGWNLTMSLTGMHEAVQELLKMGYTVERVDAGGRPEWALKII